MPNPLMRAGQVVRQRQAPQERPEPVAPVPEAVDDDFYAYRGYEDHGVPSHHNAAPAQSWDNTVDAVYHVPDPEPEPIPVRNVTHYSEELIRLRAQKIPLAQWVGRSLRVFGRDTSRRRWDLRLVTPSAGRINDHHDFNVGDQLYQIATGNGYYYGFTGFNRDNVAQYPYFLDTSGVGLLNALNNPNVDAMAANSGYAISTPGQPIRYTNGLYVKLNTAVAVNGVRLNIQYQPDAAPCLVYLGGQDNVNDVSGFLMDQTAAGNSTDELFVFPASAPDGTYLYVREEHAVKLD